MKLSFEKPLLGIDGKEILDNNDPLSMSKIVANLFANSQTQEPAKYVDWAIKIWNGQEIEVDRSDLEKIKTFITTHQGLSNLARVRILEVIELAEKQSSDVKA